MADPIQGITAGESVGIGSIGGPGSAPAAASVATETAPAPVDSANVSKTTALLGTIKAVGDSIPSVDETRVAAVRDALATGALQPQPQQIAQKLIEMDALFGRSGR